MVWSIPLIALHIPDGFLSVPVAVVGWVLLVVALALALRQTRVQLGERQVPLMGVIAAFIFAAQMINFPVAGGTSGHLIGGTLVAILLGPWAAMLVMTSVVAVQALLFQDGGLLALGFNVVNMGVLSVMVGYAVYVWLGRVMSDDRARLVRAGLAAWLSVEVAAAATALELAVSGTSPLAIGLPAMLGIHAVVGIGEALITVGALAFIAQSRPDLLQTKADTAHGSGWIAAGLLIALGIVFISPLASPEPDGLERVAIDHGFEHHAEEPGYELMPDYTAPFVRHHAATTVVAGTLGVLAVTVIGFGLARWTRRGPDA